MKNHIQPKPPVTSQMKSKFHLSSRERQGIPRLAAELVNFFICAIIWHPSSVKGIYSRLLAFCSRDTNNISIVDIDTKQNYSNFDGVVLKNQGISFWFETSPQIFKFPGYRIDSTDTCNRTYVKEIPETGLLVSIHHAFSIGANLQIYDISQKGKAQKVYSFEEVRGSNSDFIIN